MGVAVTASMYGEEETVWVRRGWNDPLGAQYRVSDLQGVHWSGQSGGVRDRSPRPMVSGYVSCDGMLDGELSHSCEHGPPPHRVKVCVVSKDNPPALMRSLKADADGAAEAMRAAWQRSLGIQP